MNDRRRDRSDEYVTCPQCKVNYLTGHLPRTITVPGRGIADLSHYRCNLCGTHIPMAEAKHYGEFQPVGAIRGRLPS